MKRGEIWTVAGAGAYTGEPRPVVIIQDDRFDAINSITICPLTSDPTDAPLVRVRIEPNDRNRLRSPSHLMVDKITTVPKAKLGARVGRINDREITQLNRAILVFLGLAAPVNHQ